MKRTFTFITPLPAFMFPKKAASGSMAITRNRDFSFIEDLDLQNFTELPENAVLGWRYNSQIEIIGY